MVSDWRVGIGTGQIDGDEVSLLMAIWLTLSDEPYRTGDVLVTRKRGREHFRC